MKAIVNIEGTWSVCKMEKYDGGCLKIWWLAKNGWVKCQGDSIAFLTLNDATGSMSQRFPTGMRNAVEIVTSMQQSDEDRGPAAQSGWSCPRCSRIYGPSVQICVPCNARVAVKEVT